ncbi:MAG TPA: YqgE/AlgH family protein [Cyclobacteriaceae bacterium]|nr:YqgE/AlgH family protein [Cyclobacteriaceae bacterium]
MPNQDMDYFNYQKPITPEKGDLLISEPLLPDPNFERTVVILCEHNQEGSIGFVLNKPSVLKFEEAIDGIEGFSAPLYVGGPVQQDTLHFIYRGNFELEGSIEVTSDINWGGNFEQLLAMMNTGLVNNNDFRFFVGYSGWAPGQLENELKQKSWIVVNKASANQVFDMEPRELWKKLLEDMGGKFRMFSNYPQDPRLN